MTPLDIVARQVRSRLQQLPQAAMSGTDERLRAEIEQSDDYPIDWQLSATPSDPNACPIDLIASQTESGDWAWGFAFDTRGRIAPILGVKLGPLSPKHVVAFGVELVAMPPERVVSIIEAVIAGKAELHYRTLAGYLTGTQGVIRLPGPPHRFPGYGSVLGTRKVFRYASWIEGDRDGTAEQALAADADYICAR